MEYRIKIDLRKSVAANAEEYYEAAKKAKEKLVGVKKALADTEKKLMELGEKEAVEFESRKAPVAKKAKEKKWFEKFHYFISSEGFLVVGGKDATTNEILIKKYVEDSDIVFHADLHGAPFFVIKNPDQKEIPEKTLKETAEAAASYSKAWKLGLGSADVYYVLPEQVSKTAPSGEYVAKGGFIISGKKNYYRGLKLEMAVGVIVGEELAVVSGPVSSVESKTRNYIKVAPGEKKSGELAKEIRAKIVGKAKKEDSDKLKKIDLEEIQKVIPGGKGRISA
jgi:predicted ribosome quality control (RQC) complex YloA/Tae2 family protein